MAEHICVGLVDGSHARLVQVISFTFTLKGESGSNGARVRRDRILCRSVPCAGLPKFALSVSVSRIETSLSCSR